MRLLPKKEISVLQANKQRSEIDEGLKLARRVDSLRETVANEEASLASFRSSTLKAIQADIKTIESERDGVKSQVETLREELTQGTKQLDIRENAIKEQEIVLKQHQSAIKERILALKIVSEELKKLSKMTNFNHNYSVRVVNVLTQGTEKMKSNFEEASTFLTQSDKNYQSVMSLKAEIEAEFKERDIALASNERDVIIRAEHLDLLSQSLHTKELQLIDREQTLEREFNRLNKK